MKKPRGVRKSQGRKRTPKDIAARAAHFEKRLDEKIIPRALSKVSPPLSQIGTQIKTQGEFVDFAPDGTPIYKTPSIVNPYQPMTVFRPDVPEEKVHDLRPLEVRDAKGNVIKTTPVATTGKGYVIPEAAPREPYPDPENRAAFAKAKYQRMRELAARGVPGAGFADPGGVISRNIQREKGGSRFGGKAPGEIGGPCRVAGNWPGGRR